MLILSGKHHFRYIFTQAIYLPEISSSTQARISVISSDFDLYVEDRQELAGNSG